MLILMTVPPMVGKELREYLRDGQIEEFSVKGHRRKLFREHAAPACGSGGGVGA